ncbi:hypothetical protein AAOE16_17480 [Ekhidna sp. MALMAid0563]|uniref:hypothetical protein n=1 Tax=Ekhidna sp. MALMAid0563 TaxID=3143937 RepID=UPI0032DE6C60
MGTTYEYYIKGNKYATYVNGTLEAKSLYKADENTIYRYFIQQDSLAVENAGQANPVLQSIELVEGTENILSFECQKIFLKTSIGEITYYYNEALGINKEYFINHKYGNWDAYTKMTGALPLKYVMVFPEFTATATAIAVEEMDLPDSFFDEIIPKDKISKN